MEAALPHIKPLPQPPRKACQCIAAIGATDVIDNLPDLFHDEAPSVRQAALDALATYPDHAKTLGTAVGGLNISWTILENHGNMFFYLATWLAMS